MSPQPETLRGATITGTGMYLPDKVLTNADLEKIVETSDAWIRERTGILERHIAAADQSSSDLGLIASQRALEAAGLSAEDVDQIIVATTTPDRVLPCCACTLQAKLGARRAVAYDVYAACSGFVFGLGLARSAIGVGLADTVLLVGTETLSRFTDYTDRNTCVLLGDGAGAAVLRPCAPGDGVLSVVLGSDGTLGEVLEIPAGGSARPASAATVERREHFIRMRGKELFKVAVRTMGDSLRQAMDGAGLVAEDLEFVIPHQANLRIIEAVRERLALPPEKVIVSIERHGNTSSASIPISLDEVVRSGRLKPGHRVGFTAFGGGVTWGATVLRWTMPTPVRATPAEAAAAAQGASA